MFNKEAKKELAEISSAHTQIMKGTTISGDIESVGNIRIEGRITGNATTKSKIVLGDSSELTGNLLAQNAEISGQVQGDVEVTELLTLKATAVIRGNITAGKMLVEPGAIWAGIARIGNAPQTALPPVASLIEAIPVTQPAIAFSTATNEKANVPAVK